MKVKTNAPENDDSLGDYEYKVNIKSQTGLELLKRRVEGRTYTEQIMGIENITLVGSIGFQEVGLYFNGGGREAHIHLSLDEIEEIGVGIEKILKLIPRLDRKKGIK